MHKKKRLSLKYPRSGRIRACRLMVAYVTQANIFSSTYLIKYININYKILGRCNCGLRKKVNKLLGIVSAENNNLCKSKTKIGTGIYYSLFLIKVRITALYEYSCNFKNDYRDFIYNVPLDWSQFIIHLTVPPIYRYYETKNVLLRLLMRVIE